MLLNTSQCSSPSVSHAEVGDPALWWMDKLVDGWMEGWMVGWIDGWMGD